MDFATPARTGERMTVAHQKMLDEDFTPLLRKRLLRSLQCGVRMDALVRVWNCTEHTIRKQLELARQETLKKQRVVAKIGGGVVPRSASPARVIPSVPLQQPKGTLCQGISIGGLIGYLASVGFEMKLVDGDWRHGPRPMTPSAILQEANKRRRAARKNPFYLITP